MPNKTRDKFSADLHVLEVVDVGCQWIGDLIVQFRHVIFPKTSHLLHIEDKPFINSGYLQRLRQQR